MRVAGGQYICMKPITDDGTRRPVSSGLWEEMSSRCNSVTEGLQDIPVGMETRKLTADKSQILFFLLNHSLKWSLVPEFLSPRGVFECIQFRICLMCLT